MRAWPAFLAALLLAVPGTASALEVSHISSIPTESYTFECTGNEAVLCPFLSYEILRDAKGAWSRTDFRIVLDSDRIGAFRVPSYYNLRTTDEKEIPAMVFPSLTKGSGNLGTTFEKGDTLTFLFSLAPNTGWAKIGDNSIYIIQGSDVVSSSILTNVTVEDVIQNFSHLTPVSPLSMGRLKGFNVSGNMTLRNLSPYHVDDDNAFASLYDVTLDRINLDNLSPVMKDVCANGCTVSAWAKDADGDGGPVFARWDNTNVDAFIYLGVDSGEDSEFWITVNGTSSSGGYCALDYTSSDVNINHWYHFIGIYSNATGVGSISIFRDGVNISWKTCPAYFTGINYTSWGDNEAAYIGNNDETSLVYFNGSIDNVLVWNRTLTAAEATAVYALGRKDATYTDANLVAAYRFDDPTYISLGGFTIALDSVSGAYNGTFRNNAGYGYDSSGLVSYWPFDGDRENAELTRHYDYNGKWDGTGVADAAVNSSCGLYGNGACFDGNGDYIGVGDVSETERTDGLTVMAWVQTDTTAATSDSLIRKTEGGVDTFWMVWQSTQDLNFTVVNETNFPASGTFVDGITDTNWHHVAGVYNGTNVIAYVDGEAGSVVGSLTGPTLTSASAVYISSTSTAAWNGSMDEVMVFDRAVTADEMATIIANQSHKFREPGKEDIILNLWSAYNTTTTGYVDAGVTSNPIVFTIAGMPYLIVGESYGSFYGYYWSGSSWVSNTTIVAGLTDVGSYSNPSMFESGGTIYMIASEYDDTFNGFNFTGAAWQNDTAIVSGLEILGTNLNNAIDVFNVSGTLYAIVGSDTGIFHGFNWTGSAWQRDDAIVSGLTDVGSYASPSIFQRNETWYLISGRGVGGFYGWNWTGSAWQRDDASFNGVYDNGDQSSPDVFDISGTQYMLVGDYNGLLYGYRYSDFMKDLPYFNRINVSTNLINYSGSIGLSATYYNGTWNSAAEQSIEMSRNYTFNINTGTTIFALNYTFYSGSYSFISPIVYDNITLESWYQEGEPADNPPTYSQNSTNTTVAGAWTQFSEKWGDETGLSGYIFGIDNCTGALVNDSFVGFSGTVNHSNVTKWVNATVGCTINWCVYANDSIDQWNSTCMSYVTTGEATYTMKLIDGPLDNLGDAFVYASSPGTNYGDAVLLTISRSSYIAYIKFNLSKLPSDAVIINSTFYIRPESSATYTLELYHVNRSDNWTEMEVDFLNQPCGYNFDYSPNCNLTPESSFVNPVAGQYMDLAATDAVSRSWTGGHNNVSFALKALTSGTMNFASKDNGTQAYMPYLNITYTSATPPSPPGEGGVSHCWGLAGHKLEIPNGCRREMTPAELVGM